MVEIEELPDGPQGRRWRVTQEIEIPAWIYALAKKHGLIGADGAIVLPDSEGHPFWDELEDGEPPVTYEVRFGA